MRLNIGDKNVLVILVISLLVLANLAEFLVPGAFSWAERRQTYVLVRASVSA